jgi:hypothetical protein
MNLTRAEINEILQLVQSLNVTQSDLVQVLNSCQNGWSNGNGGSIFLSLNYRLYVFLLGWPTGNDYGNGGWPSGGAWPIENDYGNGDGSSGSQDWPQRGWMSRRGK